MSWRRDLVMRNELRIGCEWDYVVCAAETESLGFTV